MSLHLTPMMLEASYELLRTTPPFNKWKLPEADDVEFHVTRHRDRYASFHFRKRNIPTPRLTVSAVHVKTLTQLTEAMAHEMIHAHEDFVGDSRPDVAHSARFKRLADQVCRHHGFDAATF